MTGPAGGRSPRELLAGLMRGPSSLAIAGMVVNGANLFANLALARLLDPHGYGAVVELTNIFLILSMIGSAMQVAVVQRDTAAAAGGRQSARGWIRRLRGTCLAATVVASLVGLGASGPVCDLLSYPHRLAFAEAVAAAALWALVSVERALLQARGAYEVLARNFVLENGLRVALTVAAVTAGLGVDGAGLGLLGGLVVAIEHGRRASAVTVRPAGAQPPRPAARSDGWDDVLAATGPLAIPPPSVSTRRAFARDTATALGALVPLSALQNVDVVIIGRTNPHQVGAYAAIATACKVPVFIGLAVANFLLPEAARRRAEGTAATRALLMAMAWVAAPGLLLAAIGLVAPRLLLTLVFGPALAAGAPALWVLALAMTLLANTLLFTNYLLGVGERRIVPVVCGGVVVTAGAIAAAGGGLVATAAASLGCQAVVVVLAGWLVLRSHPPALAGSPERPEPARAWRPAGAAR
jgi:O-antigen/teichoic acid export membrane protein